MTDFVNSLVTLALPTTAIPQSVDGDTATVTVTVPGLGSPSVFNALPALDGEWTISVTPTAAGIISASWVVTPAATGQQQTVTTTLEVVTRNGLITLTDARQLLRLLSTDTDDDAMIQELIDAATELIEDVVGAMVPRVYTEHYHGGSNTIVLIHKPVMQVMTVIETFGLVTKTLVPFDPLSPSTTASMWSYYFNPETQNIERRTVGSVGSYFMPGESNVSVTYQSGRDTVPATVQHACRMLVKHLYEMTMPISGRRRDPEDGMDMSNGFAVPGSVLEMLQPYRRYPGIA